VIHSTIDTWVTLHVTCDTSSFFYIIIHFSLSLTRSLISLSLTRSLTSHFLSHPYYLPFVVSCFFSQSYCSLRFYPILCVNIFVSNGSIVSSTTWSKDLCIIFATKGLSLLLCYDFSHKWLQEFVRASALVLSFPYFSTPCKAYITSSSIFFYRKCATLCLALLSHNLPVCFSYSALLL